VALLASALHPEAQAQDPSKPNILLIVAVRSLHRARSGVHDRSPRVLCPDRPSLTEPLICG
jgi:hypothetical protein